MIQEESSGNKDSVNVNTDGTIDVSLHGINERLEKCQSCKKVGNLKKVYTTIRKMKSYKKTENKAPAGQIVKKFIEETKKEVREEKDKMKSEEYKS